MRLPSAPLLAAALLGCTRESIEPVRATGLSVADEDGHASVALDGVLQFGVHLRGWGRDGGNSTTADLHERWDPLGDAVEQSWTVDEVPPGAGPLAFRFDLQGATAIRSAHDSAEFVDANGRAWLVDGLRAWDDDGRSLRIDVAATDDGLAFAIDDQGARPPIHVDPVYSTPSWRLLGGYAELGTDVGWADVDGDGYDDAIVGAPGQGGDTGAVLVYRGGPEGVDTHSSYVLAGPSVRSRFGARARGIGDVNGDGYDDIAVLAEDDNAGRIYVFAGDRDGPHWPAMARWDALGGAFPNDFGWAIATGDFDGDSFGDVAIADPSYGSNVGEVRVFRGGSAGVTASSDVFLQGIAPGDRFGSAIDAGDVNHDGKDDLIVGASGYASAQGRVYVFPGGVAGPATAESAVLAGQTKGDQFGMGVAALDIDGDGDDDVVVGAPFHSTGGTVYVYGGGPAGLATSPQSSRSFSSVTLAGRRLQRVGDVGGNGGEEVAITTSDYQIVCGNAWFTSSSPSLASLPTARGGPIIPLAFGDANGDGHPDVVVGTSLVTPAGGSADMYVGSASGFVTDAGQALRGIGYGLFSAATTVASGDVNGDGYDDVIVGVTSTGATNEITPGWVYLFFGRPSGMPYLADVSIFGEAAPDEFGAAIAIADIDHDGHADVVVGAPGARSGTGAAYAYTGLAIGLAPSPVRILGVAQGDRFGGAVAAGGDVDHDGYADIAVTATGYNYDTGRVYVYRGGPAGPATTPVRVLTGDTTGQKFGSAIAFSHDLDGDGFSELLVGAPNDASSRGRVQVFRGSAGGVAATASSTIAGVLANDRLGAALSDAGDVDADGYDDVIVGAPGASKAAVYRGSAAGLAVAPIATITGVGGATGTSVAAAGDVNGDGFADVIVGAPGSPNPGAAVFHGATGGLDPTASRLSDQQTSSQFGTRVAGVGDVDGDGFSDVAVTSIENLRLFRGYRDSDGDGVGVADDCDDADASIGAPNLPRFRDADGDGYGASATLACVDGPALALVGGDCDDHATDVHPGATDVVGDGRDGDCDGNESCYADADADGFRSDTVIASRDLDCTDPGEARATVPSGDCDDGDPARHPGVVEIPGDGQDGDCDGNELCYVDADHDGHATDGTVSTANRGCTAAGHAPATAPRDDCDDGDAAVHPGVADAAGDGIDQDCSGDQLCYVDADADGFRATTTRLSRNLACDDIGEAPASAALDCDDADANVNPDGWDSGVGQDGDCDGTLTCWVDADGDGFHGTAQVQATDGDCRDAGEGGALMPGGDCDDGDEHAHPDATEIPDDGVDQNCDGTDAIGLVPWDGDDTPPPTSCATVPGAPPLAIGAILAILPLLRRRRAR